MCGAEGTNAVDQVPQGTIEQKIQSSAHKSFSSVEEEKGGINVKRREGQQDGKNTFLGNGRASIKKAIRRSC